MSDLERLSSIVGKIYDCALDESLWSVALADVASFVQSKAIVVNMISPFAGRKSVSSLIDFGVPAEAGKLYFDSYAGIDPMVDAGKLYDADEVFTAREAVGEEHWTGTRMYREWNERHGFTHQLTGIIRKDALRVAALSALRLMNFGDAEKHRLRLLLPHFRRSVSIARMLGERISAHAQMAEILDKVATAVFVIDDQCAIRHMNARGAQLIETGGIFQNRKTSLVALSPHEHYALVEAMRKRGSAAPSVSFSTREGGVYAGTLLPLDAGRSREIGGGPMRLTALFVDKPPSRYELPGEAIGRKFRLTGAELQLLLALMDGLTLQGAADRFGVSIETVRTHLKRIFSKTDTTRQVDLVRKIGQIAPTMSL